MPPARPSRVKRNVTLHDRRTSMPQQKKHACNAARQAAYRKRRQHTYQEERRARGLPALAAIPTMPSYARWNQALSMASALLSTLTAEMADYADARSQDWQESVRGEAFTERLETLTQISEQLDEAL